MIDDSSRREYKDIFMSWRDSEILLITSRIFLDEERENLRARVSKGTNKSLNNYG